MQWWSRTSGGTTSAEFVWTERRDSRDDLLIRYDGAGAVSAHAGGNGPAGSVGFIRLSAGIDSHGRSAGSADDLVFKRFYAVTFHGILGIVLATTLVIIPTTYTDVGEVLLSALCCAGGFGLAFFLARLDRKFKTEPHKVTAFLGSPLFYSGSTTNPASQSFCKLIRMPSLAWYQVRPPWK